MDSLGSQGDQGATGAQGNVGFTGSQGDQGVIGYTGSQGDQGVVGFTGSQGDQGVIGYTGSQGIQGNLGFTGSIGNVVVGGAFVYTQGAAATTWTINHNLDAQYLNVEVIDDTGNSLVGTSNYPVVAFTNNNTTTLTLAQPLPVTPL